MYIFKNKSDIEKYVNLVLQEAVDYATNTIMEELQNYIREDFYEQYKPKVYKRTYKFLNSVATNLLNNRTSEIYLDLDYDYEDISALEQAKNASEGIHGRPSITKDGRFWDDFLEWFNKSYESILKYELRIRGFEIY